MSRRAREIAKAPRIYVCTAVTPISVHGTGPQGVGKLLVAGAQVDFEEVIGMGPDGPVTLEEALGAYAQMFRPVVPAPAPLSQVDQE